MFQWRHLIGMIKAKKKIIYLGAVSLRKVLTIKKDEVKLQGQIVEQKMKDRWRNVKCVQP